MQVQDNRTKAGASADPFSSVRETQQSFANASTSSEFDLFAEIFNSFAVSVPEPTREIANGETSSANSTEPISELVSSKDEDDSSDDEVHACAACYALPVENQPIVADEIRPAAASEVAAELNPVSTAQESSSSPQLAAGNVSNTASVDSPEQVLTPGGPITNTELSVDSAATETLSEPVPVLSTARENAGGSNKGTKTETETPVADSFVESQSIGTPSDAIDPSSKPPVDESVVTGQAKTEAITGDNTQSNDLADRRRRNSDPDHRSSNIDRQAADRDKVSDAKTSPTIAANNPQEPLSTASSTGNIPTDGVSNALSQSSSQAVLASVGSLAASLPAQVVGNQRGSGSQTQGVQAVTGSPATGGVNRSGERASDSAGAGSTSNGRRTDVADRARLVHRIAKAFQKMGIDSGQVRLKMHPDELGGVQIEMQVKGRNVKAKVIADGEDARQLLQDSLPELRQRLESQGLTVERLDVELRSENESSSLLNQNHHQQDSGFNDQASRRDGVWRRPAEPRNQLNSATVAKPEQKQTPRAAGTDRSLDLKI